MFSPVHKVRVLIGVTLFALVAGAAVVAQEQPKAVPYLKLTAPRHVLPKSADSVLDLDKAPEKLLLKSTTTVTAPALLYVKNAVSASGKKTGIYYLATETYPHRYTADQKASGR
jgi:hypothetical protein